MSKLLELSNIKKIYKMGDTQVRALDGVDLSIDEGDFVAIMGQSGSGKSTLLHILGLLDLPSIGSYKINGKETSSLTEDEQSIIRRQVIGFIFQQFNLLPRTMAVQNVALPLMYSKQDYTLDAAKELLKNVDLEDRMEHFSNELSGGQQQRVAIARSLINKPLMVLADEPTGNLDSKSEKEIMNLLRKLHQDGMTVIVVTHEEEIGTQASRIIRMRDGKILSDKRQSPLRELSQRIDREVISLNYKKTFSSLLSLKYLARNFSSAIKILLGNKARTFLSTLGILIGVAAVVSIMALGTGMQRKIEEQLASMGSNLLSVRAGWLRAASGVRDLSSGSRIRLEPEDAYAIKEEISYVEASVPKVDGRAQLVYLNKNWNSSVLGTSPDYQNIRDYKTQIGRYFTEAENRQRARVAVVGVTIVNEVFSGENPIGKILKINRDSYTVIGVLNEKGGSGFSDQDDIVIIPLYTAMYRLFGKTHIDNIDVKVIDRSYLSDAEEKVFFLLNRRHRIAKENQEDSFRIMNMAELQESANENTRVITLFLTMIAAISLLVGGIGIMNIMLVSVTERTREIGLRKAIGARRFDIVVQFLVEAVLIGFSGGVLGIFSAWGCTFLVNYFTEWSSVISSSSVLLAFAFSTIVGVVFGLYPAKRAAGLEAIEALRYE